MIQRNNTKGKMCVGRFLLKRKELSARHNATYKNQVFLIGREGSPIDSRGRKNSRNSRASR